MRERESDTEKGGRKRGEREGEEKGENILNNDKDYDIHRKTPNTTLLQLSKIIIV